MTSKTTRPHGDNWHESVFFGIHYDLHAAVTDTELGKDLTHQHLRERLQRVRPDWIQCDCKGHPGYTSWPTKVGSTAPGMVRDALRIHRDVTSELGIPLGMHYSGVIDTRALELHPDWAARNAKNEPSPRSTCRLSAYADELMIPQLLELIDTYDVDGFWVDGENWGSQPCWCDRCRAAFTRKTGIQTVPTEPAHPHWNDWLAFQRQLFADYVTHYTQAVHARKPGCLFCSNWLYTVRQPEPMSIPVDYLSGDYTPNWGAARAALEGRMLDCRGRTWDLMVWGFTRNYQLPASPWAMKPSLHLRQEVSEVVALGGAVMVYVKPHRGGWLTGWENEIVAEVADFCRARKALCFNSTSASEAAVLHIADHYYSCNDPLFSYGTAVQPVEGALNALLETHRSSDILTEDRLPECLDRYKLLLLPEQTHLSADLVTRLTAWVKAGGCLLASGAHLAQEIPELVGCTPAGEITQGTVQLPVGSEAVELAGGWQAVQPGEHTEVWTRGIRNLEPDQPLEDKVYVTCRRLGKGMLAAVHGPIFSNYFGTHVPRLRTLIAELVERLDVDWSVTLQGSPRLELICRRQGKKTCLNLINRGAAETLSPQRAIVAELLPIENTTLTVACPQAPASVRLMPGDRPITWEHRDGTLCVQIPRVEIHDILVIK